jgi:hypothetical protein
MRLSRGAARSLYIMAWIELAASLLLIAGILFVK